MPSQAEQKPDNKKAHTSRPHTSRLVFFLRATYNNVQRAPPRYSPMRYLFSTLSFNSFERRPKNDSHKAKAHIPFGLGATCLSPQSPTSVARVVRTGNRAADARSLSQHRAEWQAPCGTRRFRHCGVRAHRSHHFLRYAAASEKAETQMRTKTRRPTTTAERVRNRNRVSRETKAQTPPGRTSDKRCVRVAGPAQPIGKTAAAVVDPSSARPYRRRWALAERKVIEVIPGIPRAEQKRSCSPVCCAPCCCVLLGLLRGSLSESFALQYASTFKVRSAYLLAACDARGEEAAQ